MPKFQSKIPTNSVPTLNVMVGVAGHIDHGKTELVKMLTGCDTDRLKEEKERGMSIELGYAPCFIESGRFGIVDVPGHERFVRKMVAGATGIDMALLVIAADDGVMPQTCEHLDILELLGIRHLLIAITKIDLVSPQRIEEVSHEIQDFLQNTPYANASLTPVSSMTGDGLDLLRQRLQEAVNSVNRRKTNGVFRLAVDRVFSSHGHGTIVTGIASSGSVRIGDTVEILPLGKTARVRGLQVYLGESEEAVAGQCMALNLASIRPDEVERGYAVVVPNRFKAITQCFVHIQASRFLENPLPNSSRIHFHTGTSETGGKLRILQGDVLESGQDTFAQILLDKPVCAFLRDRFILRLPSPANTVAGGTILDIETRHARRNHEPTLAWLNIRWKSLDSHEALLLSLLDDSCSPKSVEDLSRLAGFQKTETEEALFRLHEQGKIIQKSESLIVSVSNLDRICNRILESLQQLHRAHPLRYAFSPTDIAKELPIQGELFQEALSQLIEKQKITFKEGAYRAGDAPALDPKLAFLTEEVEKKLYQEQFQTSSPKQLAEQLRKPISLIEAALQMLVESGRIRRIAEGIFIHVDHIQWARQRLIEAIQRDGFFETHLFKNLIGSSRKYAIPLLDYFDASGLTRRLEGRRYLCEK